MPRADLSPACLAPGGLYLCVALLAGCSGAPAGPDTGSETSSELDADDIQLRGECPSAARLGGFTLERYGELLVIEGSVIEFPLPSGQVETVSREELDQGHCALYSREQPFCDPSCAADEVCTHAGSCVAYPLGVDLGVVTLRGLSTTIEMSAAAPNYKYFDTSLPASTLANGQPVGLRARGASADFELFGAGVEPVQVSPDTQLVVTGGAPLDLSWSAPDQDDGARVQFYLQIDQHGLSPINLVCEFEDAGHARVPASLIDGLLDAGVSGFPNAALTRRTADRIELEAGCVDLRVRETLPIPVELTGFTPCLGDEDCPPGQSCDLEIELCE